MDGEIYAVLFVAHSFVYMLHFHDLKLATSFLLSESTQVASLSDYLDEFRYSYVGFICLFEDVIKDI